MNELAELADLLCMAYMQFKVSKNKTRHVTQCQHTFDERVSVNANGNNLSETNAWATAKALVYSRKCHRVGHTAKFHHKSVGLLFDIEYRNPAVSHSKLAHENIYEGKSVMVMHTNGTIYF